MGGVGCLTSLLARRALRLRPTDPDTLTTHEHMTEVEVRRGKQMLARAVLPVDAFVEVLSQGHGEFVQGFDSGAENSVDG